MEGFIEEEVLIEDEEACFYIYELRMQGRRECGVVVCRSMDEYRDNTIKKHEGRCDEKEEDG
ncbi:DUF1015 family protein, partial [Bacillus mycoides]|uniref:DUF1015 family protein n=1 Tax=Bacillus mycoides TaxID=1405 RepID=UPI001F2B8D51